MCVVDCTNSNVYVLSLLADFIIDEKRLFNSLSCDLAWVETRVGLTLTKHLLHPANSLFSRTTWVSRFQKCKTSLDLNEARDDGVWGWQWHQLDRMHTICTSLQTDNDTNTSSLNVCRPDALPNAQPTVSDSLQAVAVSSTVAVCSFGGRGWLRGQHSELRDPCHPGVCRQLRPSITGRPRRSHQQGNCTHGHCRHGNNRKMAARK